MGYERQRHRRNEGKLILRHPYHRRSRRWGWGLVHPEALLEEKGVSVVSEEMVISDGQTKFCYA